MVKQEQQNKDRTTKIKVTETSQKNSRCSNSNVWHITAHETLLFFFLKETVHTFTREAGGTMPVRTPT